MTDWKRLKEMQPQQWGFVANVTDRAFPNPKTLAVAGAQAIIWKSSDAWDVTPWRVYLGAWAPKPRIEIPPVVFTAATTAPPAPASGIVVDAAAPQIPNYNLNPQLSFVPGLQIYAQVSWGTGGFGHTAFVDWPIRGLLLQASGSNVQVAAIAVYVETPDDDSSETQLPNLPATLSLEPGGGDAVAAATMTYRFQSRDWAAVVPDPTTGRKGINFVVPPFARSVRFEWDNTRADASADYASSAIIRLRRPASTDEEDGVYTYGFQAGDVGDPTTSLAIPQATAYVRVEFVWTGTPTTPLAGVGAIFELDL